MDVLLIEKYFLWFILYSIIGWTYEVVLFLFTEKKFVNRGFLNGPYCPIYGYGALLVTITLSSIENILWLFLVGAVLTCTLEYLTSYAMEKLFNARWWDYSNMKCNINGRICLLGAAAFGTMTVLAVKVIHPFVAGVTDMVSVEWIHISAAVTFVIFLTDNIITFRGMIDFRSKLKELKELTNFSLSKLNYQQRRMFASFPKLKIIGREQIKEQIDKIKDSIAQKL